jgi:putative membrane protein
MQIVQKIDRADRPVYALIALWVLSMIAVPILRWTRGDDGLIAGLAVSVALQIAAVMAALIRAWGVRRALIVFALVPIIAWVSEFVGHNTGFPFGAYKYTDRLQPQIGDVPILVPLAWLMMLPPAWAITTLIVRGRGNGTYGRIRFAAVTALVFTAWDLFLDPQMVAWGLWRWTNPEGLTYFGIPIVNYGGWLLVSFTMTFIVSLVIGIRDLPLYPLIVIYVITWALSTIGLIVFWGLPGPGIVGGIVMGACLWIALRAALRQARTGARA